MRLSIRKGDPGFNLQLAVNAKVFVDGVEVKGCYTADEELGIAYCYKIADDGKSYVYIINHDKFETMELHGDVKIVLPDTKT